MLDRLETAAMQSAMRGCGFAALAIFCMMAGFTGNLPSQLKSGGYGALLVTMVLVLKAFMAPRQRFRKTETWLLLAEADKPPEAYAQHMVTNARQLAFLRCAHSSGWLAAGLLGAGLLAGLLGG